MIKYIATFYTHLSATLSQKNLIKNNINAILAPTPRVLSSSCSTCVKYKADSERKDLIDTDFEAIYSYDDEKDAYIKIIENE